MSRYYKDYSIDFVCNDLHEIINKKSTPNYTAGVISMALEVIAQLRQELRELKAERVTEVQSKEE